jgi:hypothetical protein
MKEGLEGGEGGENTNPDEEDAYEDLDKDTFCFVIPVANQLRLILGK